VTVHPAPDGLPAPAPRPALAGPARLMAPPPEEMAAVMAAIEVAWPRPAAEEPAEEPGVWRFSGRWWSKPHTVQRVRPWVERS
jgi:hypothetical protein